MRIQLPVNSAAVQLVPAGPMDAPGEAVAASGCEDLLCFADALSGLAAAGRLGDFDTVADTLPASDDGKAVDNAAAGSAVAVETPVMPALDMPLAMPIAIPLAMPLAMSPAQPVAVPSGIALAPLATAADQGGRAIQAGDGPLAGSAAAVAVPAGMQQRTADAAVPAVPVAPQPASPADPSRPVPALSAEALQPKPKTDQGGVSEHKPAAAPEAVAEAPAVLAPSPAREPAAMNTAPTVKLPVGQPDQWRSRLMEALGDRIRVEVGKHSEQAVIRLDPPMLGSVEIVLRHQGGVLQVQLSASHDEVVRQLQHIGDSLRQDLAQRQYTDVSVQVYGGSRDGDGRQRPDGQPEERQPGRALAEAEAEQAPSAFVLSSHGD